jgi:NAD(P)-dependent dehydrogenase (short-subunit alcohol dehydrogenase family)
VSPTHELDGRVAIVTGAAGAIGRASAALLANAGATVVVSDVDEAAGMRVAGELAGAGRVRFVRADVTREDDVRALVDVAQRECGRLDILFNNAGIAGESVPTTAVELPQWERILATNLTGTFLAMKYGIAAMVASGGGSVINNASILGLVGFANQPAYSAAKGGVIALTRTAAMEYAMRGVRINCICPGFVDSPLAAKAAVLKLVQPMQRFGTPEEIAQMVLYLASDRASFMTGAVVPVDGGYVAR